MGKTADVAGPSGKRQLQRGGLDADAESGAASGVRREHVVHAVQQEHGRTVPGRLGEQAVHESVVRDAAAGQKLPTSVVRVNHATDKSRTTTTARRLPLILLLL